MRRLFHCMRRPVPLHGKLFHYMRRVRHRNQRPTIVGRGQCMFCKQGLSTDRKGRLAMVLYEMTAHCQPQGTSQVVLPVGTTMATNVLSKLLPYTQICSTISFFLYAASIFSAAMYSPVQAPTLGFLCSPCQSPLWTLAFHNAA